MVQHFMVFACVTLHKYFVQTEVDISTGTEGGGPMYSMPPLQFLRKNKILRLKKKKKYKVFCSAMEENRCGLLKSHA
jgi:hypothetical protein